VAETQENGICRARRGTHTNFEEPMATTQPPDDAPAFGINELGAVDTRINRRQLLTTLAGALGGTILSKSLSADQTPGTPTNLRIVSSSKPLLTKADFDYLGCLRMPLEADTTYAYGGVTGRKVGGELRLFTFGNDPTLKDPVYELGDIGDFSKDYRTAPRMRLVTNWGDVYHGKRMTWDNGSPSELVNYRVPGGLYWNESTQLLYWTYVDSYNSTLRPDWNLGASSLDNPATGASRAYGPWRTTVVDGDGRTWYGASRISGLTQTPDGKMGGFGAYFVTTAAPWGPQLFSGADWPTSATPAGYGKPDIVVPHKYLTYYFMGGQISQTDGTFNGKLRAFRRRPPLGYVWHPTAGGGIATEIDPVRNGGVGSWTNEDGLGGAIWLNLPDKHGVVFAATFAGSPSANPKVCGTGHLWYRNKGVGAEFCTHGCVSPVDIAGPVTDAAFPAFLVYNPDDLVKVKNGSLTDYTVEPTSIINLDDFGVKTAPLTLVGQVKSVRGFHFDAERRLLFVKASSADDSVAGLFTDLIHVFAIK
jgi:hypothetical protein